MVPEPHIVPSVGKIADLADPAGKMSKSASSPTGIIELLDEPKINIKKIKSAVTDSDREILFDEDKQAGRGQSADHPVGADRDADRDAGGLTSPAAVRRSEGRRRRRVTEFGRRRTGTGPWA